MILVLDNYDSFTYNLVQYLGLCGAETQVYRNDQISLRQILELRPSGILLSPGPCSPDKSGVCLDVLRLAMEDNLARVPVFGVCLGMQAMGLTSGAEVRRAVRVRHGKASPIRHDGRGVFLGMPNPFRAIRYHSLAVNPDQLPEEVEVTAHAEDDGEVMGIRHRKLPIEGVQFHPESILTEDGMKIVQNFVDQTR